jgi:tetratricopeptide (TPR) repeat protein
MAPSVWGRRSKLVLAGAVAAVLAVGAGLALKLAGGAPPTTASAVQVERLRVPAGDGAAAVFANGLAGDLARLVLGEPRRIAIVDAAPLGRMPAEAMVLDGEVRTVGSGLHATVELHAARDRAIAWSASFDEPLADAALVREQAAAKIADVLSCVVIGDGGRSLDLETLRLYLRACDKKRDDDGIPVVREAMRHVTERAPGFSRAWAMLAVSSAIEAGGLPPDAARAARAEAAAAASRSLALDPSDGEAWVARASLTNDVRDWRRREFAFAHASEVEPDNPQAYSFRTTLLDQLGRTREALVTARRGFMLDPLSAPKAARVIFQLAFDGDYAEARTQLESAHRMWPHAYILRFTRFNLIAWFGDPAEARRLLADPESRPKISPTELEFIRRLIETRAGAAPASGLASFIRAHQGRDLANVNVIEGLAVADRADEALDFAARNADRLEEDTDALFRTPWTMRLVARPRFMPVAARLGLAQAWLASGKWPDFCSEPGLPYDCKAEAAKALRNGPAIRPDRNLS